jgi:uncharacterized protein (TIGR02246 family)
MSTEHPNISLDDRDARAAVDRFIAELQAGWDRHDAEISNRHFANDVLWGSPYGETVRGYEPLHAIHERLKAKGVGGSSSRFELVGVTTPAPDVAVAQVRRVALGDGFSEMAMYVLVHRGDAWWLAAGQNTPIRDAPSR